MDRKVKTFPAELKATGEGASGEFEALVSIFNNVDLVGDRVMPGAFTKSLERWKSSGDPIPVIWSHEWDDPNAHIGTVVEAEERPEGLYVKGQLDLENDFARQVHKLLMQRRVKEFSFAYDVVDEKQADDTRANDLVELDLIEVGPTLKGANPETQLIGAKAGRVLSKANEQKIAQAVALLNEVLAAVASEDDTGKASDGKANEPETVKAEGRDPRDLLLVAELDRLAG